MTSRHANLTFLGLGGVAAAAILSLVLSDHPRLTDHPALPLDPLRTTTNLPPPPTKEEQLRSGALPDLREETPITFYGKVIDQWGHPVDEAKVRIGTGHDTPDLVKTTDREGMFSVVGKGSGVWVWATKDGYYNREESRGVFGYARGTAAGVVLAPRPAKENPAVFVIFKRGLSEPLLHYDKDFKLGREGEPLSVDLTSGEVVSPRAASLLIDYRTETSKAFPWRLRLSIKGGGLIKRIGELNFKAPASGYRESDEIGAFSGSGRDYFFKTNEGKYGRLAIEWYGTGNQFAHLVWYINPSGSINTEYDPSANKVEK